MNTPVPPRLLVFYHVAKVTCRIEVRQSKDDDRATLKFIRRLIDLAIKDLDMDALESAQSVDAVDPHAGSTGRNDADTK